MRRNIISTAIAAALLVFIVPTDSNAQTTTQPYIDISTTVEREVTPNELYLQITINEKEYKGKKTLEQMQEAMMGALKANRIDISNCLTLSYMGSEISYKNFSKSIKPKTQATYMLKLDDVTTMQNVIAELEKRQISDIELVRTKYTKENELKGEMSIEAMKLAQSEAQTLAGAIGQEAGKAITISYWMNSGQPQPRIYKSRNYVADEASVEESAVIEPVISITKATYKLTVNVRFELK